jgi:glycosyltransferase involved in cell wall biosynthesis
MRILHVITRMIQGGAQRSTLLNGARQAEDGHEVFLLHGPPDGFEGSLVEAIPARGLTGLEVPELVRPLRPRRDRRAVRALRAEIRRLRPDVVHTHSSKAGIVGRAAGWAEGAPAVIHTVHGLPFHPGNAWWRNMLYRGAERWAARRCHRIIGLTEAMCEAFRRAGIAPREQLACVPSGIDPAPLERIYAEREGWRATMRARLGIPEEAPVIGVVARLDAMKGQEELLNVVPRLREAFPGLRVVLVGEGRRGAALRARGTRSSLAECVHFTGLVSPEETACYQAAMDLCVLPSLQEGQGRALIEAMMVGTAVVGSDVGGLPEVCGHGAAGELVRAGDPEDLRRALYDLLADPTRRAELAEAGRAHALNRYTDRHMADGVQRVYDEVLGAKPDASPQTA